MVTEIVQKIGCGWCNTGDHGHCVGWVKSYDTIWVCGCKQAECGVDSPRNRSRVASGRVVPNETASEQQTVPASEENGSGTGLAGTDEGTSATGQASTGSKRGRKPKAVPESEQRPEGN